VMTYGYNGKNLGPAFTNFAVGSGIKIGFSADSAEECRFNFGESNFKYECDQEYLPVIVAETLNSMENLSERISEQIPQTPRRPKKLNTKCLIS